MCYYISVNRLRTEYVDRLNAVKTDKSALFSAIVCALLLILIFYSFYVRVRMYMLGITLWDDEALLAENIVDRTMQGMLTPPLVNLQTAPAFFLIIVKALTLLFGASESVLRVYSFAAVVLMLIAQGRLLRKVFQVRMVYTLFSLAVSSTFLFYMQHSNELKPYTGDAAFVLVVLCGYYAYRHGLLGKGIRGAIMLALVFAVCMLFSTPAAFASGAVFIVEFVLKCIRRDRKAALLIVIGGLIFIAAFALNYFLWLKPIATDVDMIWYWKERKFEFMIFNKEALISNYWLFKDVLAPASGMALLLLPVSIAGFLISLVRKNIYTVTVGVFFILLLIASYIGKYPIQDRLWLFLYVILFIYAFVFIDALRLKIEGGVGAKAMQHAVPLILSFFLLVPGLSFPAYGRGEEWTLIPGNQANPLIEYVSCNIKDGEALYSHFAANVILKYKNGYHTDRIGDVPDDNIIYGTRETDNDIRRVAKTGGAYALFYHSYFPLSKDWTIARVIEQLQLRGYMDMVMDVYHTPLYWYTDDIARVKASAALEMQAPEAKDGKLSAVFRLENTGATILAPDTPYDYGRLYVVLKSPGATVSPSDLSNVTVLGEFASPVRPGESAELSVDGALAGPGEYQAELVAFGEYAFSELGLSPITVLISE